jgi:hypothetical protein
MTEDAARLNKAARRQLSDPEGAFAALCEWRIGEAWVFDDTIEHEAWNESDEVRIILICDIWSPRLSPDERAAIRTVIAATDAFSGTVPTAHI